MAIKMRRGNAANLDKTKLVAGEIAVCLDEEKVCISQGSGNTIDLATKTDLDNVIANVGAVRVDNGALIFSSAT